MEVLQQIRLTESMEAYFWHVKIAQCGYIEHASKYIALYVQKHIAYMS